MSKSSNYPICSYSYIPDKLDIRVDLSMTEVIKKIRGINHHYYQDTVKVGKSRKVITTLISREDAPSEKFISKQKEAIVKHYIKLTTIQKETHKQEAEKYHFESIPPDSKHIKSDDLEHLRASYLTIRKILSPEELDYIDNQYFIHHVQGTTHIEGNTLEYNDVLKILTLERSPDISSPLRDVNEVENYLLVKDYLKNKIKANKITINEKTIKTIHKYLMNRLTVVTLANVRKLIPAGIYRQTGALLSNIPFKVSPPELIEQRMGYLLSEYEDQVKRNVHPVEIASIFHQKFEEIHPFTDGNGRTGREILNLMLIKNGFPPIYLKKEIERAYYEALKEGNNENYRPLIDFIIYRMISTVLFYWSKTRMIEMFKSNELKDLVSNKPDYEDFVQKLEVEHNKDDIP
jgi:Fic family protein